jgi:CBS domain-containing protein
MKIVQHLMEAKGSEVWSVAPEDSVYEAIRLMAEKEIGALLVMDGDRLAGILSERDYARSVILKGRSSRETKVSEIMTREVVTGRLDHRIEVCLARMTERRIRHLPIVEDGQVKGMVSMGDLVKAIIAEQQATIEQLEQYITG